MGIVNKTYSKGKMLGEVNSKYISLDKTYKED